MNGIYFYGPFHKNVNMQKKMPKDTQQTINRAASGNGKSIRTGGKGQFGKKTKLSDWQLVQCCSGVDP